MGAGPMFGMRRRDFITLLGGAAGGWPLAAGAQQSRMPVLGFLTSASAVGYAGVIAAVHKGLNEAGFLEKRNLSIEYRWADYHYERLPALAAELVSRPVDVIFATGSVVSAIAAKSATSNIPVVFANGSDPVQHGLVASLNRPGGNVTGVSFINSQLGPKRIQLLLQLHPKTATIAVMVNPKNPNAVDARTFESAGRMVGVKVIILNASSEPELKEAFSQAVQQRADASRRGIATLKPAVNRVVPLSSCGSHSRPRMAGIPDGVRGQSLQVHTLRALIASLMRARRG
jgi:putative tryptophan/tyrosine transport system substrate-binding protein